MGNSSLFSNIFKKNSKDLDYAPYGSGCSVTGIGTCLDSNITVPEKRLGKSVLRIENGAFLGIHDIKSAALPEGLCEIGAEAFKDCTGLVSVKLPETLTSIEENAFVGCSSLRTVSLPDSPLKIAENAFPEGCKIEYTLYPRLIPATLSTQKKCIPMLLELAQVYQIIDASLLDAE